MLAKVKILNFKTHQNEKGSLIALENNLDFPFDVQRVYYIFNSENKDRGFHAHKNLSQLIICISGSCQIKVEYNNNKEYYNLNDRHYGLLIEGLVWREMFDFNENTVLLVLVNQKYSKEDYIFKYEEFKQLTNE